MDKKIIYLFLLFCLQFFSTYGQVAINNSGNPPDPNAILDISSNSKGLLIPRMDSTARKAMPNIIGMVVYDSTMNSIFVNDGNSWKKSKHYIGEHYGGGVVFWVDTTGEHGLIASKSDVPNNGDCVTWSATLTGQGFSYITATGLYSGEANTILMVALDVPNQINAGMRCYNYTVTEGTVVYGGWYLPAKEELVQMMLQKNKIGGFLSSGCSAGWWSSTHSSGGNNAWGYIVGMFPQLFTEATPMHARPIRKF